MRRVDSKGRTGLDAACAPGESFRTSGIITELGLLPGGTVLTMERLADMMGCHKITIKRAIDRGELPTPTRLTGRSIWTVNAVVQHIEAQLQRAAEDAEILRAERGTN